MRPLVPYPVYHATNSIRHRPGGPAERAAKPALRATHATFPGWVDRGVRCNLGSGLAFQHFGGGHAPMQDLTPAEPRYGSINSVRSSWLSPGSGASYQMR
jgi:hypothetical protein